MMPLFSMCLPCASFRPSLLTRLRACFQRAPTAHEAQYVPPPQHLNVPLVYNCNRPRGGMPVQCGMSCCQPDDADISVVCMDCEPGYSVTQRATGEMEAIIRETKPQARRSDYCVFPSFRACQRVSYSIDT